MEGEPPFLTLSDKHSPGTSVRDPVTQYGYFDYNSMVDMLNGFETDYPDLVDLSTAQDVYSIPDCVDGYKTYMLRISNETRVSSSTPEVLFLGGIHGDEKISVSAAMYLAKFLLENYHNDEYLRYLVDNREIYIMPCLNPYGLENGQRLDGDGEDVNRDFSFDQPGLAFTSVGALAVHELMRDHLFISAVNWHSGTEAIGYAWGCEAHDTATDESPDDSAFYSQAQGMRSYAGDYRGLYPVGRNNQVIYYARGAFSDYAYAASWEAENSDEDWPTGGCRALGYTVEISDSNEPELDELGTDEFIYYPGGDGDGYIPKNIRLALYQIDTASPYVREPADYEPPEFADPNGRTIVKWVVGGCEKVDSAEIIASSVPDVKNNTLWRSSLLPANSSWENLAAGGNPLTMKDFQHELPIPMEAGTYYYQIKVIVDGHLTEQGTPSPLVSPQSLYAKLRTMDNEIIRNGDQVLYCSSTYESKIYKVVVNSSVLLDPLPLSLGAGESLGLEWRTSVTGGVNRSYIAWGERDPRISPDYMVNGTLIDEDRYGIDIILPDRWGNFLFVAVAIDQLGKVFFSQLAAVSTWPSVQITSLPHETLRDSYINISWSVQHAETVDSSYVFAAFSGDLWNNSLVSAGPFSGDETSFTGRIRAPDTTGLLRLGVRAQVDSQPTHFYSSVETIRILEHFSISGTILDYTGGFTQILDVTNVTVSQSEPGAPSLGPDGLSLYAFTVTDSLGKDTNLSGNLSFDPISSVWGASGINVSNLSEGSHYVRMGFRYDSIDISSQLSGSSLFYVDHTISVSSLNFTFSNKLTLIIQNLTIISSKPNRSPLPGESLVNSTLELFYDNNGTPLLNVRDMIIFDPLSREWSSLPMDLGGAMPGKYRFILSLETVFANISVSQERFTFVIPELVGVTTLSITNLSYTEGPIPVLELGGIVVKLPDRLNGGPYFDYFRNTRVDFKISSTEYHETRAFYPVFSGGPDDFDFNLSGFPSGTYGLSGYFSTKVVFPLGGSLVLGADYIYPLPIIVEHRYWFGDSVNVTVRQDRSAQVISSMDMREIELFSTWDHDFEKNIMLRAMVMRGTMELFNISVFFHEQSGYWEILNVDISTLEPGDYYVRLEGKIDNLTFTSGKVFENRSRFRVGSGSTDDIRTGSGIAVWVCVVLVLLILLAAAVLFFIRNRKRRKQENSEVPVIERDDEQIRDSEMSDFKEN